MTFPPHPLIKNIMAKENLDILLGIRISLKGHSAKSVHILMHDVQALIHELGLDPLYRSIPIHWNFPCVPFLEGRHPLFADFIRRIEDRCRSGEDLLLPMGYSGAPHPVLEVQELLRELKWCQSNPWKSGIRDVFGACPPSLLPLAPDFFRKEAKYLYRDSGFDRVGVILSSADFRSVAGLVSLRTGKPEILPVLQWVPTSTGKSSEGTSLVRSANQLRRQGIDRIFLLYDPGACLHADNSIDRVEFFRRTVDALRKGFSARFLSLGDLPPPKTETDLPDDWNEQVPCSCFQPSNSVTITDPRIRRGLLSIRDIRKQRYRRRLDYRFILETLSPSVYVTPAQISPKPLFPSPNRQTVADMQGDVILSGQSFSVRFVGGCFHGLRSDNGQITLDLPTQSYLKTGNRVLPFESKGTFSIEDDDIRGLREIKGLRATAKRRMGKDVRVSDTGNGSTVLTEYYLAGNFPFLLLTSLISYPRLENDGGFVSFAPLEIPLIELCRGERVTVWSLYRDGSSSKLVFQDRILPCVLTGDLFFFQKSGTGILVGFPPGREVSPGICPLKIERVNSSTLIKINPFGFYNSRMTSGSRIRQELFNLYLGAAPSCPGRIPRFPGEVLKEIPDHWIQPDQ